MVLALSQGQNVKNAGAGYPALHKVLAPLDPPGRTSESIKRATEKKYRQKNVPGLENGRQRAPKWSQNGDPGPSGDGLGSGSGPERPHIQSNHYLLYFSHIGHPRKSSFFDPAGTQNTIKSRHKMVSEKRSEKRGPIGATMAIVGSPGHLKIQQ